MTDTQAERPAENLYLLGHPIAHSASPAMYNAVYERLGLPWRYGLADCATEEEARSFVEARGFLSINITTPYKPLAFEAATAKAATAKLAQGANVLVKKGDALIGFNTDGQGCVAYLERTGFCFAGKRVAVCGTGPTALSILHACAIAGADVAMLVGRDKERSRKVLEGYVERFGRCWQMPRWTCRQRRRTIAASARLTSAPRSSSAATPRPRRPWPKPIS